MIKELQNHSSTCENPHTGNLEKSLGKDVF